MQITNPFRFINLGGRIRYLGQATQGYDIAGKWSVLWNMIELRKDLENLGFRVSANLFDRELSNLVKELEGIVEQTKEGTAQLTSDLAKRLTHEIVDFEKTVHAETLTRIIAIPESRRIPVEHLLEHPETVLGSGIFASLTEIGRGDIREACRCLAFECSTAAAFHVLRCVEECVRVLYSCYFPREKVGKQTWGQLVTHLRQKLKNPKPDATLLAHLDHLRGRFRNPTDHPDKCYQIEEAEDLLHVAVDAINRCIRDPRVQNRRKLESSRLRQQPGTEGVGPRK
ncbi:MAG: hypothetical protein NTZ17_07890 [Phycisphaerae bacterium]|nr:hypothetical protein [Phycisphaerae bacterium]